MPSATPRSASWRNVYFLNQITSTSFAVAKVDAAGTTTTLLTTTTVEWKDIAVVGNYLFILQIGGSSAVLRYSLSDLSTFTTLSLSIAAKNFATDGGNIVYLSGNSAAKDIIYFDATLFNATSVAKTARTYTALTLRSVSINSVSYRYAWETAPRLDRSTSMRRPSIPGPARCCPTALAPV